MEEKEAYVSADKPIKDLVQKYKKNHGLNIITKSIIFVLSLILLTFLVRNQDYLNMVSWGKFPVGNLFVKIMWVISFAYFVLLVKYILMYSREKTLMAQMLLAAILLIIIIAAVVYYKPLTQTIQQSFISRPGISPQQQKNASIKAFVYINELRMQYDRQPLNWNENLFNFADARAKDLYNRKYFDHITPEGYCVKDMKVEYGFASMNVAENIGAIKISNTRNPGKEEFAPTINATEQVDDWMLSRGHRYNLLYPAHNLGAMSCYRGVCVFLATNTEPLGLGAGPCTSGESAKSFWDTAVKQTDEV